MKIKNQNIHDIRRNNKAFYEGKIFYNRNQIFYESILKYKKRWTVDMKQEEEQLNKNDPYFHSTDFYKQILDASIDLDEKIKNIDNDKKEFDKKNTIDYESDFIKLHQAVKDANKKFNCYNPLWLKPKLFYELDHYMWADKSIVHITRDERLSKLKTNEISDDLITSFDDFHKDNFRQLHRLRRTIYKEKKFIYVNNKWRQNKKEKLSKEDIQQILFDKKDELFCFLPFDFVKENFVILNWNESNLKENECLIEFDIDIFYNDDGFFTFGIGESFFKHSEKPKLKIYFIENNPIEKTTHIAKSMTLRINEMNPGYIENEEYYQKFGSMENSIKAHLYPQYRASEWEKNEDDIKNKIVEIVKRDFGLIQNLQTDKTLEANHIKLSKIVGKKPNDKEGTVSLKVQISSNVAKKDGKPEIVSNEVLFTGFKIDRNEDNIIKAKDKIILQANLANVPSQSDLETSRYDLEDAQQCIFENKDKFFRNLESSKIKVKNCQDFFATPPEEYKNKDIKTGKIIYKFKLNPKLRTDDIFKITLMGFKNDDNREIDNFFLFGVISHILIRKGKYEENLEFVQSHKMLFEKNFLLFKHFELLARDLALCDDDNRLFYVESAYRLIARANEKNEEEYTELAENEYVVSHYDRLVNEYYNLNLDKREKDGDSHIKRAIKVTRKVIYENVASTVNNKNLFKKKYYDSWIYGEYGKLLSLDGKYFEGVKEIEKAISFENEKIEIDSYENWIYFIICIKAYDEVWSRSLLVNQELEKEKADIKKKKTMLIKIFSAISGALGLIFSAASATIKTNNNDFLKIFILFFACLCIIAFFVSLFFIKWNKKKPLADYLDKTDLFFLYQIRNTDEFNKVFRKSEIKKINKELNKYSEFFDDLQITINDIWEKENAYNVIKKTNLWLRHRRPLRSGNNWINIIVPIVFIVLGLLIILFIAVNDMR